MPGSLDRVCDFLASPAGRVVGICGGRVVDDVGQDTVVGGPFPTLGLVAARVTGLARHAPRLFASHHPPAPREDGPMDHVIGAFLVVRREVFERLHGFDERYFMYYEEVDLCLRARRQGWSTYFLSDARVVHSGNVSSNQVRAHRLYYSLCSRRRYAAEHWSLSECRTLMFITFTVELFARLATEVFGQRHLVPRETLLAYTRFTRHVVAGGEGKVVRP
jgi:GT2 family glycosyltransferase